MTAGSRCWWPVVALTVALVAGGCARDAAPPDMQTEAADTALSVCVSIPPQAFVVERIGGDRVAVEVLVGPGQSPATYEPTPAQMAALDGADVYFRIGVPFEDALMERISASMTDLKVVDLRDGIDLQPVGGHTHEHAHGRMDPHTWLDPKLVEIQAGTVHGELTRLDPESSAIYDANLAALRTDLMNLDSQIAEMLKPVAGQEMFVFHPAYGYFARAYDLEQVPIEIEGKEPAPRELQQVIELARDEGFRAIFVQPQFSDASARAVAAEVDAEIVRLDPLARDYIANLREIARNIRDGLTGAGEGQ
ncbi:MAG: cation ABC transporter substrate-binding protein [Armatimonadia bacterium]|nr:cation ABC transporter substrate-binding protein [Armatimonadia bacterium]